MATLTPPVIDPRDEETQAAEAIDALPAELSDRSAANPAVKVIEACAALYAACTYALNQWPVRVMVKLLQLLGIEIQSATYATVDVTFTRSSNTADLTIPAGTVVKTGTSASAIRFQTIAAEVMASGGPLTVAIPCRAVTAGAEGNVAAGTLTFLDTTPPTVTGVTNTAGATGGQDEETQDEAVARAPLEVRANNRAVTAEDFETLAVASENGVTRAVAYSLLNGGVTVDILVGEDMNETPSPALQSAVQTYLTNRTLPGVVVEVNQRTTYLVAITNISVDLGDGYTASGVKDDIKAALAAFFDGTVWEYGEGFVENDLVYVIRGVEGVDRVNSMEYSVSDDYGATAWDSPVALTATSVDAPDTVWGILHWGYDTDRFDSMANDPDPFLVNGV